MNLLASGMTVGLLIGAVLHGVLYSLLEILGHLRP